MTILLKKSNKIQSLFLKPNKYTTEKEKKTNRDGLIFSRVAL